MASLTGGWPGRSQAVGDYSLLLPVAGLILLSCFQILPIWGHIAEANSGGRWPDGVISADPYGTQVFILKLGAVALFLALLIRHTAGERRLRALALTLIAVGVVSATWALWKFINLSSADLVAWPRPAEAIGFGQFADRNHFAYLMEMVFGLLGGVILGPGMSFGRRAVCLLLLLLVCSALILSNSRGGVVSLSAEMIWFFLLLPAKRGPTQGSDRANIFLRVYRLIVIRVGLAFVLIAVLVGGAVLIGDHQVWQRLESVPSEWREKPDPSRRNARRREIWQATGRLIVANPFTGAGFGAYPMAITRYYDASGEWVPPAAHNEYLELAAGGGILAVGLGIWFFIILFRRSYELLKAGSKALRLTRFGALTGIVGVAVHSLFDFGLHDFSLALTFCVLIVIATTRISNGDPAWADD